MGLERFRHPRNSTSVAKSGRCPSRGVPSTCCVRSALGAFLPGSLWAMSPSRDHSPPPVQGQPVPLTWNRYSCKLNNQEGGWISVSFLVSLFAFFFFSLTQNTFQLLIINSSLLPCFRASPAGQRSHRAGTTCLQPPTPGLPREDAGTQDLGLVGTGLRAESRPVSLIRRVDALLHWSLPRGSVCPGLHACLRLPGAGWPKPQACPGLLCTPDKKRHCHKGGSGAAPHRPRPHRRPVVRARHGASPEGIQEVRDTRTGRGHSPPARWALGAQVPVSCCLPRRGRVPGAVGKGRGRGPLPSAPVCPGVAVQPCRLPVSWLYRVSRLMEAPLLACPYSWLLGDRRGVWPTFPP